MDERWLRDRVEELVKHHSAPGLHTPSLMRIFKRGERRDFRQGDTLFQAGDKPDAVYVLFAGALRFSLEDVRGEQRELAIVQAPAIVGHVGVLAGGRHATTCEAALDSIAVVLGQRLCGKAIGSTAMPGVAFRHLLLSSLGQQLSRGNARLRSFLAGESADVAKAMRQSGATPRVTDSSSLIGAETETDVKEMAGVAEGWDVDATGTEGFRLVEDEEMRRARHIRSKR